MGYYLGLAKFEKNKQQEQQLLRKALIIPIILHGTYDFLIFATVVTQQAFSLLTIPLLGFIFINVKRKIKHLHVLDKVENAIMPIKLKFLDYAKMVIGMIFFTLGVLILISIGIFYLIPDPNLRNEIFGANNLNFIGAIIWITIFWFIAYKGFLKKFIKDDKKTKKNLA
jgi:hypothetical protein